jgi:S-adenosylmethionine synthetase
MIRHVVQGRLPLGADIQVNTADGPGEESLYLTVTGTSAESGDDGEVGRGNRANGLITPYRPMTLEASAGKNPLTHTGKLYQATAQRIAERLASLEGIDAAECYLVSQIGKPITEPLMVDLKLNHGGRLKKPEKPGMIEEVVRGELDRLPVLWKDFLNGTITLF